MSRAHEERGTKEGQKFDQEPQQVKNKVTLGKTKHELKCFAKKLKKLLGPTKNLIRT